MLEILCRLSFKITLKIEDVRAKTHQETRFVYYKNRLEYIDFRWLFINSRMQARLAGSGGKLRVV